jgi:hypothetical protein
MLIKFWYETNGISHLIQNLFGPLNHAKESNQSRRLDINGRKSEERNIRKDTKFICLYASNSDMDGLKSTHMPNYEI